MKDFGWEYPPGVTGTESHLTGIWPCIECDGFGYDSEDEDGRHTCLRCKGTGDEPEAFDIEYVEDLAENGKDMLVLATTVEWAKGIVYDRHKETDRRELRAICKINRKIRE